MKAFAGFHTDWPALLRAIDETQAETVWVTRGYRSPRVRCLDKHDDAEAQS
ncbi:MAG TPA: hypothetical protein VGH38_04040 [Bryobacteraceae bacterium]